MDQKALVLKFWDKEAETTRKVLSRIPEGSDYRPDPKSRPAREIAWLIVHEMISLTEGLEKGVFEWVDVAAPATMKEVLEKLDAANPGQRLAALPDAKWAADVPFKYQGQTVMSASGYDNAWGFLFDIVHHRGQISTYLRPMGAKVPQIYGP